MRGELEAWAHAQGHIAVLGVDEVGRGPLAGPVVAGCVALPSDHRILGITDSKKLSARARERLDVAVRAGAVALGLGVVDAATIDRIGILPATFEAMRRAVATACAAGFFPDVVLVDGKLRIPALPYPQQPFVKADARSDNVGAASIVAKVWRDAEMTRLGAQWPAYGFGQNAGYGTAQHLAALRTHGPCPIHRRSFRWGA